MAEPCGWTVTSCSCSTECWTKRSPASRARAEAIAGYFMWAATGRRYGLCEVTVLPCSPGPAEPLYQTFPVGADGVAGSGPYIQDGTWHNAPCGGGCSCTSRCEVELAGPVADIVEVLIDGEPVSPDAYRVYDGRLLARIDGGCWPSCQTFGQEIPGFQVAYNRGLAIPTAVHFAYSGFACQVAKACEGAADCALPPRMRSLTRQGVAIEVATEETRSEAGKLRTGIKWIDDVIEADNPHGRTQRPRVYSPDLPGHRVITSAGGS